MNILYVAANEYFPHPHAGSTHIYNICRGMRDAGNNVVIAARKKDRPSGTAGGMDVHYIDWTLPDMALPLRPFLKIMALCRKYGIDVVHERHSFPGGAGVAAAKALGIPCVLEMNSPLAEEFYPFPAYGPVQLNTKLQESLADMIITQTPILKKIIAKNTGTKIEVIPNGADPDFFAPGKKKKSREKTVAYVGTFTPWHGVTDLLKAFAGIEDARLMLVGGGGNAENCKKFSRELGLKNVIFTGPVSYDKLPDRLSDADVFVAPFSLSGKRKAAFLRYGFWWSPVKIFEYMAMGKPVISADLGMVPEYISGAGLTYRSGDAADLGEKIRKLLADGGLRERLGKAGRRKIIEKYSWKKQAEKTLEVYEKILKN